MLIYFYKCLQKCHTYVPNSISNINFTPKFFKYSRIVVTISTCLHAELKRDTFFSIINAVLRNLLMNKNENKNDKSGNNSNNYYIFTMLFVYIFRLNVFYLVEKSSVSLNFIFLDIHL